MIKNLEITLKDTHYTIEMSLNDMSIAGDKVSILTCFNLITEIRHSALLVKNGELVDLSTQDVSDFFGLNLSRSSKPLSSHCLRKILRLKEAIITSLGLCNFPLQYHPVS